MERVACEERATMKQQKVLVACAVIIAFVGAADSQARPTGNPQIGSLLKRAKQVRSLIITEEDEIRVGTAVSERVRLRYGVVQDPKVHRYVSLVGSLLAQASSRPNLAYTFIVLDTDGVNAFAAPGGFIHITRGALALMSNEAELAGVLGHEMIHVTEKHTMKAIQKGNAIQIGADETLKGNSALFSKLVDKTTEMVMAGFGRNEELESDRLGVALCNKVGYSPSGLDEFLHRLAQRNKASTEKQGLFASHPEMQERFDKLENEVKSQKLTATATLAERFKAAITYTPRAITEISTVTAGAAGLAGGTSSKADDKSKTDEKTDEPKKKSGFSLGGLLKPGGSEKKTAEVTGSGASRGVDTERNAKGGAVPTLVVVQLTPGDIEAFRKQGNLK
jgi:predicted Zn-dependent protease